jgi:predicted acyl esterase
MMSSDSTPAKVQKNDDFNNNGRAGIWGISYPGFYAADSLIGSHPALKALAAGTHGGCRQR